MHICLGCGMLSAGGFCWDVLEVDWEAWEFRCDALCPIFDALVLVDERNESQSAVVWN
jgi:hypothetical protein